MARAHTQASPCPHCRGRGKVTETRTEIDTATSVALGTALGIGMFPAHRTVTVEITCHTCGGSGAAR